MKISIVTTAYNIESYIKQCLDSILAQTYRDIEVIIVNDCSTDSTAEIVNSYEDGRIKVINHATNMGAGWARRHGIEAATGEYVITIDGDDWISEDFIERLVENAEATDADIISGGITIYYNEEYQEIKRFAPTISREQKKIEDYNNEKIIFLNNKLVKRSMYDLVPYSTRVYCEDTPVILPLLYYANMVSYVDTQGYYYRQHNASLCRRVNDFEQGLFKALCCKELMEFFATKEDKYKGLINDAEFLRYLKMVKDNINTQMVEIYKAELGELMPTLLRMVNI